MILKLTISTIFLAMAAPTPVPTPQSACSVPAGQPRTSITPAQSGMRWCCCGGCCGYAHNCNAVPGCTSC